MADITLSTISAVNTAVLATENSGAAAFTIPTFDDDSKFIIIVDNQDSVDASLNILATNAVGNAKGQGNLEIEVDATQLGACVIESARFKNSDGEIECSITNQNGTSYSGTVGSVKVTCYKLP